MLPLTLSGLGLPQVTYVGLLAAVGIAASQAVASHVLMWVAWLPMYLVGAGILLRESLGMRAREPSSVHAPQKRNDD